jgi:hypothetical protein
MEQLAPRRTWQSCRMFCTRSQAGNAQDPETPVDHGIDLGEGAFVVGGMAVQRQLEGADASADRIWRLLHHTVETAMRAQRVLDVAAQILWGTDSKIVAGTSSFDDALCLVLDVMTKLHAAVLNVDFFVREDQTPDLVHQLSRQLRNLRLCKRDATFLIFPGSGVSHRPGRTSSCSVGSNGNNSERSRVWLIN